MSINKNAKNDDRLYRIIYGNEYNKCKRFTYKFCIETIRKNLYR